MISSVEEFRLPITIKEVPEVQVPVLVKEEAAAPEPKIEQPPAPDTAKILAEEIERERRAAEIKLAEERARAAAEAIAEAKARAAAEAEAKEALAAHVLEITEDAYKKSQEIIEEASRNAAEIVLKANTAAETVILNTIARANRELEEAIRAGFEAGSIAGKAEITEKIPPALENISNVTNALIEAEDELFESFRDDMFSVIGEILRKVINKEMRDNDDYLLYLFTEATNNIKIKDFVKLTVCDQEHSLAIRHREKFLRIIGNIPDFQIISDPDSPLGTCVVESAKAIADSGIERQLEKITDMIEELKNSIGKNEEEIDDNI